MSEERHPLVLFVPVRKFVGHVIDTKPSWWDESNAAKKGTYPLEVLVSVSCTEQGVSLALDPWLWMVKRKHALIMLTDFKTIEEAYEAERRTVSEQAAEDARRDAWKKFPSFKRWQLLRKLADTPS